MSKEAVERMREQLRAERERITGPPPVPATPPHRDEAWHREDRIARRRADLRRGR